MRVELTIKTQYLSGWGAKEGVRELIQNAVDADGDGYVMSVKHTPRGVLRIHNDGASLPHEALLLGHTTKGSGGYRGQYGEGLKLGVLALLRAGYSVSIRSGDESWSPALEHSERFDAEVLVFTIRKAPTHNDGITVKVRSVSAELWAELRAQFLFLREHAPEDVIKTSLGSVLLNLREAGRLYVSGIFVENCWTRYGYDMIGVPLDRDRRTVNTYDRQRHLQQMLAEAATVRPDFVPKIWALVSEEREDTDGLAYSAHATRGIAESMAAAFRVEYGENAVPVRNLVEARELEHLGVRGIVVGRQVYGAVAEVLGETQDVIKRLATEVCKVHNWSDLTVAERTTLDESLLLIGEATPDVSLADVDVVDFRSPALQGLAHEDRIKIARKTLASRRTALATIVHEAAHVLTGSADGSKSHVMEIERIWSVIADSLWTR